jgi:uncharacterized membrane protein
MDTPNFLASLWGMVLIIVPLSMLINPKRIKDFFSKMEDENSVYGCSIICFIIGTATVLLNNVWAYDWKTIVTILGWVAMIRGLLGLLWTEGVIKFCAKIKDKDWISYVVLAALFLGLIIVYFGFIGK